VSDEFCAAAAEAEELGDGVDAAFAAGPEELESVVTAALEASEASLELAPADIADAMERSVDFQQRFAALLEENDWDAATALATPEGLELQEDGAAADEDLAAVRRYLELNCGIEDDSDDPDDTAASVSPQLADGDAGVRQFIQLYAVGAGVEVTEEQEDCFVEELAGKVEVEQLEQALTSEADEDVKVDVGLAVLACDIPLATEATTAS
jgi:hypothetical protein